MGLSEGSMSADAQREAIKNQPNEDREPLVKVGTVGELIERLQQEKPETKAAWQVFLNRGLIKEDDNE